MAYLIELRRADLVKPSALILAQHDGVLGPWRVVDASLPRGTLTQPGKPDEVLLSVILRLLPQGQPGRYVGDGISIMLPDSALVPMLVPAPEPVPVELVAEEQRHCCSVRIEVVPAAPSCAHQCQCGLCRADRLLPCIPGTVAVNCACIHCGSTTYHVRCPGR